MGSSAKLSKVAFGLLAGMGAGIAARICNIGRGVAGLAGSGAVAAAGIGGTSTVDAWIAGASIADSRTTGLLAARGFDILNHSTPPSTLSAVFTRLLFPQD
jgi:hypothetical protein